ncbi:hypothetical protein AB1Y20_008400 [Prymnesium parvum]|uniref:Uncharacterized protein n=2 Tax=Prymnesium parvum TaxID=97485 RepID=A0AB34IT06_PRYPA
MAEGSPLELEHMMGFAAAGTGSVHFHPTEPDVMVSYTGRLVVLSNIHDAHQQEFLKGHNEEITCLALSPMGTMIASGQVSTTRVPRSEAMVLVWDYKTRMPLYRLVELNDGITFTRNKVTQLSFSPDELFLAGSDDNPRGAKLCVWQCQTGQLSALAKTGQKACAFLAWGEVVPSQSKTKRSAAYSLLTAIAHRVLRYAFNFDIYTMQYSLTADPIALPSSGLERSYFCAQTTRAQRLVAGSLTGELVVFNAQAGVFRACVPVSQGGLLALAAADDAASGKTLVYCGCGDGKLKLLCGEDTEWEVWAETSLCGSVLAVCLSSDKRTLLAGTSGGNIYLLDAKSLSILPNGNPDYPEAPLLACHTSPITSLAFGESSEHFVTGSSNALLRRWELSHYCAEYTISVKARRSSGATDTTLQPDSLAINGGKVVSGWSDGAIRCHDEASGGQLFEIAGAHRGSVLHVCLTPLYIVSGGRDGSVRVWSDGDSHSLVGNFDEHRAAVSGLRVDRARPSIVYSCSEDKTLVTIDLAQARRTHCHVVKEGPFSGIEQIPGGDMELVTCDATGAIKWWDSDISDQPLSMLVTWSPHDHSPERKLTSIALSPPSATGDGEYLLLGTATGDVQVWDLRKPERAELLSQGSAHSEEVSQARWSPDGKQVVSVGRDSVICVWNFFGSS